MASILNSKCNLSTYSFVPSKSPFELKASKRSLSYGLSTSKMHHTLLSRRLFLPSVSGIWDAITGGNNNSSREALIAIRQGMQLFRQGDVSGSLLEFDKAIELDPRQKACRFTCFMITSGLKKGHNNSGQMLRKILMIQRSPYGASFVRLSCMDLMRQGNDFWRQVCPFWVGRDSRPVMRESYNMFKEGGDPEKLASAFLRGKEHEYFYASLYAGLYYESQNDKDDARRHIQAACKSPYGSRSDDYMAALAKVHCLVRNWSN